MMAEKIGKMKSRIFRRESSNMGCGVCVSTRKRRIVLTAVHPENNKVRKAIYPQL